MNLKPIIGAVVVAALIGNYGMYHKVKLNTDINCDTAINTYKTAAANTQTILQESADLVDMVPEKDSMVWLDAYLIAESTWSKSQSIALKRAEKRKAMFDEEINENIKLYKEELARQEAARKQKEDEDDQEREKDTNKKGQVLKKEYSAEIAAVKAEIDSISYMVGRIMIPSIGVDLRLIHTSLTSEYLPTVMQSSANAAYIPSGSQTIIFDYYYQDFGALYDLKKGAEALLNNGSNVTEYELYRTVNGGYYSNGQIYESDGTPIRRENRGGLCIMTRNSDKYYYLTFWTRKMRVRG